MSITGFVQFVRALTQVVFVAVIVGATTWRRIHEHHSNETGA